MSFDINDKKNLPIVIGGFVVIAVLAVVVIMKFRGPAIPPAPAPTQTSVDPSAATPPPTPTPGGAPVSSPTPGAPAPAATPTPGQPGVPGTPGAPGATAAAPGTPGDAASGQTQTASAPAMPMEPWRPDPFAPLDSGNKNDKKSHTPVPRLSIPMLGRLFEPKPVNPGDKYQVLKPQPPRRVAGILLGNRVSALLQTPDGWETVTPGGTLRDGSVVQRIERDRVIIKTADANPRIIVIKLAAADIQGLSTSGPGGGQPTPMSPRGPRLPTPGPGGRPM